MSTIINFMLQMEKLRFRKVEKLLKIITRIEETLFSNCQSDA